MYSEYQSRDDEYDGFFAEYQPASEDGRPEAYIIDITDDGQVIIGFTEEIAFPEDFLQLLAESKTIYDMQVAAGIEPE